MATTTVKRRSKTELKEWLGALGALYAEAKVWAENEGWATREYEKEIHEEAYGDYVAHQLLVHAPEGRVILDPVAGYVPGTLGVVDFLSWPGYDRLILARESEGWRFLPETRYGKPIEWSKRSFLKKARHLIELSK
jgi:hypothetical protein